MDGVQRTRECSAQAEVSHRIRHGSNCIWIRKDVSRLALAFSVLLDSICS